MSHLSFTGDQNDPLRTDMCHRDHHFEKPVQSPPEAFEMLRASGMVSCAANAGRTDIESLMAPSVRPARKAAEPTPPRPLSEPSTQVEEAFAALRKQVEENSEYVGLNFVNEARAIHEGEKPGRSIYGEARPDEARRLIEDGVPVAPLPFMPSRKTN